MAHTSKIYQKTIGLCKNQDETYYGSGEDVETNEPFDWIMLTDGHGTNDCIFYLRTIKLQLSDFISTSTPIETMNQALTDRGIGRTYSTGATCCIAKCYANRVVCSHSGDSKIVVYKNKKLTYISHDHNSRNENERKRVLDNGLYFMPNQTIKMKSLSELTYIPADYLVFKNRNCLACTQCLGHFGQSEPFPDVEVIYFGETDEIRVLLFSDGVSDMLLDEEYDELYDLSVDEIVDRAERRWKQSWITVSETDTSVKHTFKFDRPEEWDDVSCIELFAKPKQTCKSSSV